ncbi:NADH-quinone oxidoreductase subunit C [uncultured Desulfuromusa sp.]|uniref:NADH-quinone oxidoreductase subunit C n=1 Tax=uncultured Desulfuromusa sp. TaxID=219183 RepID=UPI002AA6CB79|nr:NADH-quinone oxidoreductase subunit C [uncultured Desulfuromusa sp.]
MSAQGIVEKLKAKFPAEVLDVVEFRGETTVTVKKEQIVDICMFMRDNFGYNLLCDLCGVDYMGQAPRFMVVYNLYNITTKERFRIKAPVAEEGANIDTVSTVWGTANWHERECWDLLGIKFNNHPDLRRILMPADWEGHPLRKDYPVQGPDREPYKGRVS